MDAKKEILNVVQQYLTAALIEKDIEKASAFLADEIISCDMNTTEFLISKEAVVKNLCEKIQTSVHNYSFQIKEEVINVYDNMAIFMGKIVTDRKTESKVPQMPVQYSVALRKEDDWKICASHYSLEESSQDESWGFSEENIAGGILSTYIDKDTFPLRYINNNLLKLMGYTKEEFADKYGKNALGIVYEDDLEEVKKEVVYCMEQGKDWKIKHRMQTKDGKMIYMLIRGRKSLDAVGREIVTNFSIDMTDMHLLQERVSIQAEELEAQNEELSAQAGQLAAQQEELEAQNEELIVQSDRLTLQAKELMLSEKKFRIALAKSKNSIFDYDIKEETIHCFNLMHPEKDRIISIENIKNELIEKECICKEDIDCLRNMFIEIKNGDMYVEREIMTLTANGEKKWYKLIITAIFDSEGEPVHAIGTAEDISRQKKAETALRYKAEYDLLTEVYNKVSSMEKIEQKLSEPGGIQRGVFMIMDVDCFKNVNDTYGHPCGDKVLAEVAEVLKNNFRETDVVGRLGGDEFCIFVEGTKNIRLIRQKAEILNQEIRELKCMDNGRDKITVSIGITTCNGVQKDFEQVYREADNALYRAKQKGKDTFCFFED